MAADRDPKQRQAIEAAAQAALDARAKYPDSSLADLYDPLTMPSALVKAHHNLMLPLTPRTQKRTFPATATAWRSCSALSAASKPVGIEKNHASKGLVSSGELV